MLVSADVVTRVTANVVMLASAEVVTRDIADILICACDIGCVTVLPFYICVQAEYGEDKMTIHTFDKGFTLGFRKLHQFPFKRTHSLRLSFGFVSAHQLSLSNRRFCSSHCLYYPIAEAVWDDFDKQKPIV